jgi:hypothetical protein
VQILPMSMQCKSRLGLKSAQVNQRNEVNHNDRGTPLAFRLALFPLGHSPGNQLFAGKAGSLCSGCLRGKLSFFHYDRRLALTGGFSEVSDDWFTSWLAVITSEFCDPGCGGGTFSGIVKGFLGCSKKADPCLFNLSKATACAASSSALASLRSSCHSKSSTA